MTRELEAIIALIFVPISGFLLWDLSYFTGALAATVAMTISVGLYIFSQRKGRDVTL